MFRPVIPACFRVQHSAPPGLRAHSLAQSRSLRLPLALPKGRLVPAWADGCAPVGPAPSSLSCWLGIVACCTRADIFLTGKPLLQNRLLSVFRRKAFISLRRLSRRRCPGRLRAVRRAGGSVGALRFCGRYRSWRKLSRPESRPGFVRAGPHSLTDPLPCTAGSVYPLCKEGTSVMLSRPAAGLLRLRTSTRCFSSTRIPASAFLASSGTSGRPPGRRAVSESLSGGSGAGVRAGLCSLPFGFVRRYRLPVRNPYVRPSGDA